MAVLKAMPGSVSCLEFPELLTIRQSNVLSDPVEDPEL